MNKTYNLTPVDFNPFSEDKEIEKVALTTEAQKEIWLSCVIGGHEANLAYNESTSLKLEGTLDLSLFQRALHAVVSRHEALRSTFSANGENIFIYRHFPTNLKITELVDETKEQQQLSFRDFIKSEMNNPFDLTDGPLFRFFIHKLADSYHYFTLFKHHIAGDGWSTGVILEDLATYYNALVEGRATSLPLPNQISDYAKEELIYAKSDAYKAAEQYWLNLYKESPPPLDLPTDYPRTSPKPYNGNRLDFPIDGELLNNIRKVGAKAGCTLVNTLITAFEVFLYKKTGQQDVTLGLPTAGQIAVDKLDLVGHCVNFLPLRSTVNSDVSFSDYLRERKPALLDALDHQRFTYGALLKKINVTRDDTRIPLTPVVFNVDIGMDNAVGFAGLNHTLISNPRTYEAFELFLNITKSNNDFIFEWSYKSDLFKAETITEMMSEFCHLLDEIVEKPNSDIRSLPIMEIADDSIVSAPALVYDRNGSIIDLITEAAIRYPSKTAVIFDREQLCYEELEQRSNRLAHYLIEQGISKGSIVGLVIDRCTNLVVSLLGILKSGATYIPIDPDYPIDRINFMLEDAGAALIMTERKYAGMFGKSGNEVFIEQLDQTSVGRSIRPNTLIGGNDVAYILYTSGSTGTPKGVMVKHSSLTNLLTGMRNELCFDSSDSLLAVTTVSFDIAVIDLFLPLISGGTMVLVDTETAKDGRLLCQAIKKHQVSFMQATPATWRMLIDLDWEGNKKLTIISTGEALPKDLAEALLTKGKSLWNCYGPTETTVWCTAKKITETNGPITIGQPIANTRLYILDENKKPVPKGHTGELFIAGDGVALGYMNRPELTGERFVTDIGNPNEKMYASGDLAKLLKNREVQCLGRIDSQVKIRGYRIELGEIEYQLSSIPGIKDAVVDAKPSPKGDPQLVAYVIGDRDRTFDEKDSVSWKDRWDTIYDTGVEFNKSVNLAEHQIDGSIHRQLENSEELQQQAKEWLKESVDRIRKIGAKRIVEVGSGAGQILFEIAPSTSYYLATDYAHTAIDKLSEQLAAHPDKWGHVEAKTAPADDFSGIPEVSLDLVLVNSVAQYFPDANYFLNVIENAAKVVKPGGCIFIGDMQGKNSLEMCHAIDQFRRSSDGMSLSRFKEVVKNRVRIEEELVADPGFFYLLPILIPAITAVDIQLRKGLLLNETTNYHYDVWLYVNSTHQTIVSEIDHIWDDVKTEDRVRHLLTTHTGKTISITGIPNKRTAKDFLLSTILQQPETGQKTIGEIKPQVEAESTGFLPDTFWAIGEKYGYDTRVRWSTDGTDGCFEAIFLPPTVKNVVPATMAQLNTSTKKAIDFVRQPKADEATSVPAELIKSWKNELSKVLPDYMVPAHYVEVKQFPLTPNKKVDRKALPAIDWQQQRLGGILPKTTMEKLVASIWEDCLGITNISLDDNFFEMGGHSLIVVKMMAIIEKEFGTRLPLASLFKYPTIKQLSELLEDSHVTTSWESLVPIKPTGNKPPLYLVHGIGLNVLFFQETVRHLDSDQPVFALQAKGLDGSPRPDQTVEEIAADYNREILKHNPTGPYALSGYSYGGVLAVEMAKQLKAMGKDVSFVGLFDTYANTSTKELLGGNNWNVIKFQLNKMLAVPLVFAKYPYHYMKDKYFYAKAHLRHFVRWLLPNNTLFNEPPKYFRRLRDQHMDALKKYSLTSYDGDITLFRSKEKIIYMPFLDTNGWRPSISGDIHIVEIPGNHAQLFQEPIVGILGKELQKRLDEIHLLKSQSEAILNEQTA